jgi:hypothetical protein
VNPPKVPPRIPSFPFRKISTKLQPVLALALAVAFALALALAAAFAFAFAFAVAVAVAVAVLVVIPQRSGGICFSPTHTPSSRPERSRSLRTRSGETPVLAFALACFSQSS